ncbi:MAG: hypothetical protein O3A57_10470 [Bacteroidetes bacterium]|nr:hypothetical protein [Bacteroidota bacterium]
MDPESLFRVCPDRFALESIMHRILTAFLVLLLPVARIALAQADAAVGVETVESVVATAVAPDAPAETAQAESAGL